ncbi:hypothetical protein [Sporolactobacillus spathodeae]|uniref:Tetratricopeptide (TPR) repeat protein n=1 Tax=Sporolactobacillus spathodeae TaxID=1465502 RepID=A0ABS2QAV2_9BACL|nr:hypothetical protein [Sporolactobacillus spathodeae]MBM7658460.1 tetratricopeptide (TPR) repeat protein [Sporolactobacillus spathodeae]
MRKYLSYLLISALLLNLAVLTSCANNAADVYIEKGKVSLTNDNYVQAENYFKKALQKEPGNKKAAPYEKQAVSLEDASMAISNKNYNSASIKLEKIKSYPSLLASTNTSINKLELKIQKLEKQNMTESYKKELKKINSLIQDQQYDSAIVRLNTFKDLKRASSASVDKELKKTEDNLSSAIKSGKQAKSDNINTSYNKYTNNRFGFSIEYPSNFNMGEAPTNNDGRTFSDGQCNIIVSGSNNSMNETLNDNFSEAAVDVSNSIDYQVHKKNYYVLSYVKGNNIVYIKTFLNRGAFAQLNITYPSSLKSKYDPIVAHLVQTFTPGHEG